MKILVAPDSFKGSISAKGVCDTIEKAAREVWADVEVNKLPVADGGEGTVEAIYISKGGDLKKVEVKASLPGETIEACYLGNGDTAIIEMAQANGLEKILGRLDAANASTFGTGEMIKKAIDEGYKNILIGIGGSATNDGGTGAMQALGAKFIDKDGNEIERMCGGELINVASIDLSGFEPRVKDCDFTVMCDVDNPLTGPEGAIYTFGPQKGATGEIKEALEEGMKNYEKALEECFGYPVGKEAGAGAAGGLGVALLAFLKAKMVPGIEKILDYCDFDEKAKGADMIITGEGKVDSQTLHGKAIKGISDKAGKAGVPVVVFAGAVDISEEDMDSMGIRDAFGLIEEGMTVEYSIAHGEELLYKRALDYFKTLT